MQTGIADAGVQRPLVLMELLEHPPEKARAAANAVLSPRALSVGSVDSLSSFRCVTGFTARAALTRRRTSL